MGILRIILALSVIVAHVGPLFGLQFFGNGVMAVETFYMLSGFYMALVISIRYHGRIRDFYFNRFLRLFPIYWILVLIFFVFGTLYRIFVGNSLGALAVWRECHDPLLWIWGCISNLTMVGADWAQLYGHLTNRNGEGVNGLIAIQPIWSVSVEIVFYLAVPFVIRLSKFAQIVVFLGAIALRAIIWALGGHQWTLWLYYFAPATWVFFMGGVLAYHSMTWFEKHGWFNRFGVSIGRILACLLVLQIVFYSGNKLLHFQDWRYYAAVWCSLPFVFSAFKNSFIDGAFASLSYPIYLAHYVIISLYSPLRHFVPPQATIYAVVFLSFLLCLVVLRFDASIQSRFKRIV